MAPQRRSVAGFTLTELMIVMVLLGVLVAGVMESFTVQKQSTSLNRQIVDAQHTGRLVGDALEWDVRHTGFLVPESGGLCAVDATAAPDVLFLTDAAAVNPASETTTDLGARITGGLNVGLDNLPGTGSRTLTLGALSIEAVAPAPAYDNTADGVADSDFQVGAGVIITDAGNPERGSACGAITGINVGASTITATIESAVLGALPATPEPVDLVAIPAHVYRINAASQLVRNGVVVADDVEDLQVAVFIDADDDRTIDANEYRGVTAANAFDPAASNISLAREVRVNFVVRTSREDAENEGGRFQDSENRAAVAGADGFRRRFYTTTVMLRNIGSRVRLT